MSRERPLDDVRREIDSIDDNIQDLLIRRTELVEQVRAIKRDWRVKIQPSREAEIIYRLLERHRGPFPKRDLVAMWRILICATLSFEGPFSVAVYAPPGEGGYWDLARDHFGSCTPMTRHGSVRAVIEVVHRQDAVVGVLPLPRHDDADPWWRHIVTSHLDAPKIIARLPFAGSATVRGGLEALAICPVGLAPTGRDRSFLAVESEHRLGLNQFNGALREVALECVFAAIWREEQAAPQAWLYLAEVDGFLANDDGRLQGFARAFGKPLNRLVLLGGYAQPLPAESLRTASAAGPGTMPLRQVKDEDASAL
jgi:chorismate mutase